MPPQAENLSPEFGLLAGAGLGASNAMCLGWTSD